MTGSEVAICDRIGRLHSTSSVFGLGQCSLDYLGIIGAYPPPNVKCEFSGLHMECGGPVATAMVALSRWGFPCYFAGLIGDDDFGRRILDSLRKENVETGGVVVRSGHLSQFAFIAAEPTLSRRTIFWQRPTGPPLGTDEIDLEKLGSSGMFYTDGLFMEASLHACRKAREAGIRVMVDAGTLRDGMLELAAMSDCFIASESFSRELTADPLDTCRRLAGLGCRFTGVTLGSQGYVALVDGRWIRKPAYPAAVVDTTGCGDLFHAGMAYGILNGWDAEDCLDLGAWAAACVSTQMGGRKGIPDAEAVRRFEARR
jgi:ribokinase